MTAVRSLGLATVARRSAVNCGGTGGAAGDGGAVEKRDIANSARAAIDDVPGLDDASLWVVLDVERSVAAVVRDGPAEGNVAGSHSSFELDEPVDGEAHCAGRELLHDGQIPDLEGELGDGVDDVGLRAPSCRPTTTCGRPPRGGTADQRR